jgi:hypothetical protein
MENEELSFAEMVRSELRANDYPTDAKRTIHQLDSNKSKTSDSADALASTGATSSGLTCIKRCNSSTRTSRLEDEEHGGEKDDDESKRKEHQARDDEHARKIQDLDRQYRRRRRVNGLQWPPHPLQVVGWAVLLSLTLLSFGAFVPALPAGCHVPLFAWCGVIFGAHYLTHFLALAIDPADPGMYVIRRDRVLLTKSYCVILLVTVLYGTNSPGNF